MFQKSILPLLILMVSPIRPAIGQTRLDSLQNLLSSSKADTARVGILIDLSRELRGTDPKKALDYSGAAIDLSQKLQYPHGEALARKWKGMVYYKTGEFAEAIDSWQKAISIYKSVGDQAGEANLVGNIAAVYSNFGEDTKALEMLFTVRKEAEAIGDPHRILTVNVNIGYIYLKKDSLDKAIGIYLESLPIAVDLKDNDAIGTIAVNLGEAYYKKGDYPSALKYYRTGLEAFEKTPTGNLAYAYYSIGNVYAKQGDYQSALAEQNEALRISTEQDGKPDMVWSWLGLAETYRLMGNARKAIECFGNARDIARAINANFELRDAYKGLADTYASISDFQKAYHNQLLLTEIKDVLFQSSNDHLLRQQQLGNDLVRKEGEVQLQKVELQRQRFVKNAFLGGLLLILLIAFILLRNYLNKVKINRILDKQKAQIETLLLNILPRQVAAELQEKGSATPRDFQSVSVLFTDFKGFTRIAEGLSPADLVAELNLYFHAFDDIVEKFNLEKIKTIGDAYMCAGGIPIENESHPVDAVKAGMEMQKFILQRNVERTREGLPPWDLRVGIHTGPVIAGVVGRKKYAFDIWGNTVNVASRMESNGEAGRVNVSSATYERVRDYFECQYRGKISAKNIGEIDMYFIDYEKN